ncbi:hypothetical protein [Deinococcus saxicola]|uniref:hypothetical protein n=1 Tax=Deinococcus saxicola TaxID=249406 RepID=UPI0039EF8198
MTRNWATPSSASWPCRTALTPEKINQDRLRFAESLIEEAEHAMNNLGIKLAPPKIQNVSDIAGYLESIGRRQTAEVLKEACVAEAERNAEATQSEAQAVQRAQVTQSIAQQAILEEQNKLEVCRTELGAIQLSRQNGATVESELAKVRATQNFEQEQAALEALLRQKKAEARQRSVIAQTASQQAIVERENELRVRRAELEAVAASRESEAKVGAERARVVAEPHLEQERIILNQKRLEADVVAPARARREAELLAAQAAAPIIEEGRAKAEAVRLMVEAFRDAGPEGERACILNMLPAPHRGADHRQRQGHADRQADRDQQRRWARCQKRDPDHARQHHRAGGAGGKRHRGQSAEHVAEPGYAG